MNQPGICLLNFLGLSLSHVTFGKSCSEMVFSCCSVARGRIPRSAGRWVSVVFTTSTVWGCDFLFTRCLFSLYREGHSPAGHTDAQQQSGVSAVQAWDSNMHAVYLLLPQIKGPLNAGLRGRIFKLNFVSDHQGLFCVRENLCFLCVFPGSNQLYLFIFLQFYVGMC